MDQPQLHKPREPLKVGPRGGKVYTPPGKGMDIRKWNKEDVDMWMTCFLRPDMYPNTYLATTKQQIDGETLYWMVKEPQKDIHQVLQIPFLSYRVMMRNAAAVINKHTEVTFQKNWAKFRARRNRST
ncbi:hypothetical protein CRE_13486 [Caenorhabditis remanei]|uniref:Uncharacterized protein n=2 Tax=Caenorhabditis remanei TaxID=31234 RepID=E3MR93_CAERE|nr:hypothetical protein CRE_13486 [Caenorhabditis remanei]